MPIPVKGDIFVTKEKDQAGVHINAEVTSVVGQPVPQDTGGTYLVFAHEIHRDIIPHQDEEGREVAGHEQVRFAIRWNPVLLRWEENNL